MLHCEDNGSEESGVEKSELFSTIDYQELFFLSDDAIVGTNLAGEIVCWNTAACRLFGYSEIEALHKSQFLIVPPARSNDTLLALEGHIEQRRIGHYRSERRHKSGHSIPVSISVSYLKNSLGDTIGFVEIMRDISNEIRNENEMRRGKAQLRKTNEALILARKAADAAVRERDRFIAVFSHEFRTTLMNILCSATSLRKNDLSLPKTVGHLSSIINSVAIGKRLIEDLYDACRINEDKFALCLEPVEISSLLQETITSLEPQFEAKEILLEAFYTTGPFWALADPVRLRQVVTNLLKNALKFTERYGAVTVKTYYTVDGGFGFCLKDTGIGIPESSLHSIFEMFNQGKVCAKKYDGLGIGLAVCRKLVEAHGGKILVESEGCGKGSTFAVELPSTSNHFSILPDAANGSLAPARSSHKILLVDDNVATREAFQEFLTEEGHAVVPCSTMKDALSFGRQEKFQILVSDIDLPDGTGYEIVAALKRNNPNLRAISVSGYETEQTLVASRRAGFDEHLLKPVEPSKLSFTIAGLLC